MSWILLIYLFIDVLQVYDLKSRVVQLANPVLLYLLTYREHKTRDKYRLTSAGEDPDWYEVYTQSGGLLGDLDKAFKATRLG